MVCVGDVDFKIKFQYWILKVVFSLFLVFVFFFVYGFILFMVYLFFIDSCILLSYGWVGLENYFKFWWLSYWEMLFKNFGVYVVFYILIFMVVGLILVIFLDQKICGEGILCLIYLYLMVLSFIVIGIVWKWFLDSGIGFEYIMYFWGWESFEFNWIKD